MAILGFIPGIPCGLLSLPKVISHCLLPRGGSAGVPFTLGEFSEAGSLSLGDQTHLPNKLFGNQQHCPLGQAVLWRVGEKNPGTGLKGRACVLLLGHTPGLLALFLMGVGDKVGGYCMVGPITARSDS